MLTAMKQEVTRKHKAEKWALDDVVYHTEVTSYERMEQASRGRALLKRRPHFPRHLAANAMPAPLA